MGFFYHSTMKAYKYRLYPNAEQKVLIAKHFGCARFVYSWTLSEKKMSEKNKHHKETGQSLSKGQLQDCSVSAGSTAKGVECFQYGSQEAPTIAA